MEHIIDHFGTGILAVLGTVGIFAVYKAFLSAGGAIYEALAGFMVSICGR